VDGLDVHQQRVVAQVAALIATGSAYKVFVVSGCTDLQNPALHRDGPHAPVALDEGVLHFDAFAKYAVAFPRMSRSIFTRASSARSRLISICSALTGLLSAPVSLPGTLRLDPVEQRLIHHAQRARRRRDALAAFDQPHGLLLELERVARSRRLRHLRLFLLELNHSARDTFFGGKVIHAAP